MFLQKLLVIACLFAQVALSEKLPDYVTKVWNDLIEPYHDNCWNDANASQADLDIMYNQKRVENSYNLGCYFKCLYQKMNIMKADGSWDLEVMKPTFHHCKPEVLERCSKDSAEKIDFCEKSQHFANCVVTAF